MFIEIKGHHINFDKVIDYAFFGKEESGYELRVRCAGMDDEIYIYVASKEEVKRIIKKIDTAALEANLPLLDSLSDPAQKVYLFSLLRNHLHLAPDATASVLHISPKELCDALLEINFKK